MQHEFVRVKKVIKPETGLNLRFLHEQIFDPIPQIILLLFGSVNFILKGRHLKEQNLYALISLLGKQVYKVTLTNQTASGKASCRQNLKDYRHMWQMATGLDYAVLK